ncbi:hypothetical protein D3C86_1988360 [compost metagenome]
MLQRIKILRLHYPFKLNVLLLLLWRFGLQPFGCYTGIRLPIGNGELMPVSISTLQNLFGKRFITGVHRAPFFKEKKLTSLHGDNPTVTLRQSRQENGI